ncbi:unnamed protein product [Lampetra fluviatilis]
MNDAIGHLMTAALQEQQESGSDDHSGERSVGLLKQRPFRSGVEHSCGASVDPLRLGLTRHLLPASLHLAHMAARIMNAMSHVMLARPLVALMLITDHLAQWSEPAEKSRVPRCSNAEPRQTLVLGGVEGDSSVKTPRHMTLATGHPQQLLYSRRRDLQDLPSHYRNI